MAEWKVDSVVLIRAEGFYLLLESAQLYSASFCYKMIIFVILNSMFSGQNLPRCASGTRATVVKCCSEVLEVTFYFVVKLV